MTRGLSGSSRAMQSFCCCSSCRVVALVVEPVLEVVPQADLGQRRLDRLVELGALQVLALAMDAQAEDHVFIDRNGQRIGALEHHADRFAQFDQRNVRVVDVLAQDLDFAGGGDVAVALVDAVEAAQQGGLAAAGRPDERGDEAVLDVDGDVDQRLELAVPQVQVAGRDAVAGGDRSSENPVDVFVSLAGWPGARRR